MKKLFISILSAILLSSSGVWAHLSVSPFYIEFDANSSKRSEVVRMSNTSPVKKTYRIKLINFRQNKNGSYEEIKEPLKGNPFASSSLGEASKGIKIDLKALYGVTIPVIIDKGNLSSQGSLKQVKLINSAQNPYVEATIARSGSQAFWGTLIVKEGKEEIGRVNNFKIFLTTPERIIKIPLAKNPVAKIQVILMDARTDAEITRQNI